MVGAPGGTVERLDTEIFRNCGLITVEALRSARETKPVEVER